MDLALSDYCCSHLSCHLTTSRGLSALRPDLCKNDAPWAFFVLCMCTGWGQYYRDNKHEDYQTLFAKKIGGTWGIIILNNPDSDKRMRVFSQCVEPRLKRVME